MMLVVSMFDQAWRPFYLERAAKPEAPALMARVLTLFVAGSAWLALGLSFFLPDLVRLELAGRTLIHPAYWSGLAIVPVVLFAYVFHGAYINFLAPIAIAKKNEYVTAATALGATVSVAAYFVLIPRFNLVGAAWGHLLAHAAMAFAAYRAGRYVWAVPYEWRAVAATLAPVLASGGLAWFLSGRLDGGSWFAARAALLLAVPVCWVPVARSFQLTQQL